MTKAHSKTSYRSLLLAILNMHIRQTQLNTVTNTVSTPSRLVMQYRINQHNPTTILKPICLYKTRSRRHSKETYSMGHIIHGLPHIQMNDVCTAHCVVTFASSKALSTFTIFVSTYPSFDKSNPNYFHQRNMRLLSESRPIVFIANDIFGSF